jgi:hypothetical protein
MRRLKRKLKWNERWKTGEKKIQKIQNGPFPLRGLLATAKGEDEIVVVVRDAMSLAP